MKPGSGRAYEGWRYSPASPWDKRAAALLAGAPEPPSSASLADRAGGRAGVLDQQRNDCVAHAVARGVQIALTAVGAPLAPLPSRDWVYYLAGLPTSEQTKDDGRFIRDAFGAVSRMGWPDESAWPYGNWPAHPGGEAFREAFDRRAHDGVAYHRLTDDNGAQRALELKQAIAAGYPVVGGTLVTTAFENQDGLTALPMADQGEAVLGGHAICFPAYDAGGVRFCNSWSPDWGADGWGYLSWDWFSSNYVSDVWAVQIVPGLVAGRTA